MEGVEACGVVLDSWHQRDAALENRQVDTGGEGGGRRMRWRR